MKCTTLRKAAANVAKILNQGSEIYGYIALGGGIVTAVSGVGEVPSGGLDTGITISAGSVTAFAGNASLVMGAGAAAFNSYANGDFSSMRSFDYTRLAGVAAKLAVMKIPFVGRFNEAIGAASEKATSLFIESKNGCQ